MRHRLEYAVFKILGWFLTRLPFRSVRHVGSALGYASYYLIKSRREVALDNLRHAFPEKREAELREIAKGSFRSYGIALIEFFSFPSLTPQVLDSVFRKEDFWLVQKVNDDKTGGIFLTGHFGNWELLAVASSHYCAIDFAIIVQTQSNAYFNDEINKYRAMFGNRLIPMGISVREIIRTLQNGGGVAIAADQSGAKEGVYVDFFGRSVATHQGPAVFALKCNVPMLLGLSTRRKDGTYAVEFNEIPSSDLKGYSDENVLELTRRHVAALEEKIREHPDQWLWMHRRWKNTWESVQKELLEKAEG